MNSDQLEPEQHPWGFADASNVMGDLAGLLEDLPSTWQPGSEHALLIYLWSVLQAKEVVQQGTHVDRINAVAALLALHRLKSLFYHHVFAEGASEHHSAIPAADVIGEYPKAEAFWIGAQAGNATAINAEVRAEDETAWPVEVLSRLAETRYPAVVSTLHHALGAPTLFAALWTSRDDGTVYPLAHSWVHELSDSVSGEFPHAWDWFTDHLAIQSRPRLLPRAEGSAPSEQVIQVLEPLRHQADVYFAPDLPAKKLRNIRRSAQIPADEEVLALINMTVFGSGKDAIAFTPYGLYYRHMYHASNPYHVTYADLPLPVTSDGHNVRLGGLKLTIVGTSTPSSILAEVLTALRDLHTEPG